MWRAFFLAMGLSVAILGLECLLVDNFVLAGRSGGIFGNGGGSSVTREMRPPSWAPWSLITAGVVTMLYSFTIPQRVKG